LRWWNVSISLNRLRIPHCQVRHEERWCCQAGKGEEASCGHK
jgi:hypothetical protein